MKPRRAPPSPARARKAPAGTEPPADPPSRAGGRPARPRGSKKPQWPADRVERRPLTTLIPYARNPRTHSEKQIAQLAASMKEWGWTIPVLVDEEGVLIAGHGRILAAPRLGWTEAPVMVARGWTQAQKQAYRVADNQLALNAGWNQEMLGIELGELRDLMFDLELLGLTVREIDHAIGGKAGRTDPDAVPPVPEHPVSQKGDLWRLGSHRLLCGDCTVPLDVLRALAGIKPHLMVTDPPYGVDYDPAWRNRAAAAGTIGQRKASRAVGPVVNDDRADWRKAWKLFPGEVAYVWHAGTKAAVVQESLEVCGLQVRTQIIWVKNNFAIGRGHYHVQHEPCWYAVKRSSAGHWVGDRSQTTVWHSTSR